MTNIIIALLNKLPRAPTFKAMFKPYRVTGLLLCFITSANAFAGLTKKLPHSTSTSTSTSTLLYGALEPPAISLENLSCTHDGGDNWQLQDVSYVLPRGASKCGTVGSHAILFRRNLMPSAYLTYHTSIEHIMTSQRWR